MALNIVQRDFVNDAARPHMEQIVKALHVLDTFVADYDALQSSADALPVNSTVLDDGPDGTAPRDDAPVLTGGQVKALRDLSASMSAVIDAPTKEILISKMVRALAVVLRLQ
jgi:hypothetical protein